MPGCHMPKSKNMNTRFTLLLFALLFSAGFCLAQDDYQISTLFKGPKHKASGGYGAITNKFTELNGQYANMVEIYGGWYINHKFLLGIGGAAVTNNLQVPYEHTTLPDTDMSYAYVQFGLVTEYTLWSHRAVHVTFHAMNGPGFTAQYLRSHWDEDESNEELDYPHDTNWFFVTEPGVKVEVNVTRWMRISPGVSYRAAFGSTNAKGLSDSRLSGTSLNLTMKFGKF
jgi:hypothetical protein